MEKFFKELSQKIIEKIDNTEDLMINFWGEDSHFTRFNQSKVRQNGFVSDATLSITLISNQKTCSTSFSLSKNASNDLLTALSHLEKLRKDINFLPEDPFIVFPKEGQSSSTSSKGKLLSVDKVVDALSPAIKNVDLAGIWASGTFLSVAVTPPYVYVGNGMENGITFWDSLLSTDDFSFKNNLSLAPNPNRGEFTIYSRSSSAITKIKIYNSRIIITHLPIRFSQSFEVL